ncbi:hypothetical protein LVY75_35075 (plasmid) [Sinorhizobium sp. B11]
MYEDRDRYNRAWLPHKRRSQGVRRLVVRACAKGRLWKFGKDISTPDKQLVEIAVNKSKSIGDKPEEHTSLVPPIEESSKQQELASRPDEKEKLLPIGSPEIKKKNRG